MREGGIRVKRELEDGWFQHVEMPLPALLDHSIRHQQAALRHADGNQEGQDQRDPAGHGGRSGYGARAPPAIALDRIYLPERPSTRRYSRATPKKRPRKLVEKLKFEARVI